jgi:hypothetical protein
MSASEFARRTDFDPTPFHVALVVDNLKLGQGVFSEDFSFSLSVSFHRVSILIYSSISDPDKGCRRP